MEDLEKVLSNRYLPKTPMSLSRKIISLVQNENKFSLREIMTPSYAFAMTVFLLVGLAIGIETALYQESIFFEAEEIGYFLDEEGTLI